MTIYYKPDTALLGGIQDNISDVLQTLGLRLAIKTQLSAPYYINASDVVDAFDLDGNGTPKPVIKRPPPPQSSNIFLSKILRPAVELEAANLGIRHTYAPWGYPKSDLRVPALLTIVGGSLALGYFGYLLLSGRCD